MQQVHTPFRPMAEAILVPQSHNKRGEQVLERAPASVPEDRHLGEDEWSGGGRGTISKGRGWQQWGGNGDNKDDAQQLNR